MFLGDLLKGDDMTRRMLFFGLVAAISLSLANAALAGASADEWASIKKDALQQYMSSTDQARVQALMKMGRADCRGAAELLIKLLKARTPEEDQLLRSSREIEKQIDGIYARNKSMLKKNMMAQVDMIEIQKLTLQLNEIHKKVNFLMRVKQKVSDALALCKSQVDYIIDKMLDDSDWQVRMEGIQALAAIGTEAAVEAVKGTVSDEDFKIRTEALDISDKQNYKGMEQEYITALKDDWWQVRTIAIRAIRAKKIIKAVGPLIEALEVEDGRLTLEIDDALYDLTGKRYYGDRELWSRWWAANKEKFEAELEQGKVPEVVQAAKDQQEGHGKGAVTTSFYGIKTASKRIIFVLDISGSMSQKAETPGGPSGGAPQVTGPGADNDPASRFTPKDDTKIEVAKCELKKAICNLPDDALFNIVFYNQEIEVYQKAMVKSSKGAKEAAYRFIDAKGPAGMTNIHDSLQKAFEIAPPGKGTAGKAGHVQVTGSGSRHKPDLGGVDTIFFLTDGKPTDGKIVDPQAILAAVRLWNGTRKIQIHTVGIGDHDTSFLQNLAQQNGGTYVKR